MLESICEGGSISLERIVEGSSLSIEGVSEGLSCVSEGSVLSGLHIANNNFHVGKSFINASFECISLCNDSSLNCSGSLLINSIGELFLESSACSLSLSTEVSDIMKEFIDSFADSAKGSCVSLLESIVEFVKELM